MAKIVYTNKVTASTIAAAEINKITAANMNEIKTSVNVNVDDIAAEITDRENADTALQNNIDTEVTDRENAVLLKANIANPTFTGNFTATGQGSFGGDVKVTDKLYSAGDILTLQSANGLGGSLILNDGADTLTSNFDLFICESIKADFYSLNDLNTAPASASATGVLGEIRYTATYIYVCTATNTWKRVAISTF